MCYFELLSDMRHSYSLIFTWDMKVLVMDPAWCSFQEGVIYIRAVELVCKDSMSCFSSWQLFRKCYISTTSTLPKQGLALSSNRSVDSYPSFRSTSAFLVACVCLCWTCMEFMFLSPYCTHTYILSLPGWDFQVKTQSFLFNRCIIILYLLDFNPVYLIS